MKRIAWFIVSVLFIFVGVHNGNAFFELKNKHDSKNIQHANVAQNLNETNSLYAERENEWIFPEEETMQLSGPNQKGDTVEQHNELVGALSEETTENSATNALRDRKDQLSIIDEQGEADVENVAQRNLENDNQNENAVDVIHDSVDEVLNYSNTSEAVIDSSRESDDNSLELGLGQSPIASKSTITATQSLSTQDARHIKAVDDSSVEHSTAKKEIANKPTSMMCPSCKKEYKNSPLIFCPNDGVPLKKKK